MQSMTACSQSKYFTFWWPTDYTYMHEFVQRHEHAGCTHVF